LSPFNVPDIVRPTASPTQENVVNVTDNKSANQSGKGDNARDVQPPPGNQGTAQDDQQDTNNDMQTPERSSNEDKQVAHPNSKKPESKDLGDCIANLLAKNNDAFYQSTEDNKPKDKHNHEDVTRNLDGDFKEVVHRQTSQKPKAHECPLIHNDNAFLLGTSRGPSG